jgi:hypothetical protein
MLVAGALAVAAAAKFADRSGTRTRTVALLGSVGGPVAAVLPFAEIALAVALLAWWGPFAGLAATALLVGFTVVLARAARRGVPCPCFGAARVAAPGARAFIRNGVLALAALGAVRSPAGAGAVGTILLVLGFVLVLGIVEAVPARRPTH